MADAADSSFLQLASSVCRFKPAFVGWQRCTPYILRRVSWDAELNELCHREVFCCHHVKPLASYSYVAKSCTTLLIYFKIGSGILNAARRINQPIKCAGSACRFDLSYQIRTPQKWLATVLVILPSLTWVGIIVTSLAPNVRENRNWDPSVAFPPRAKACDKSRG